MKMPCAVSGRRYARPLSSSTGPSVVLSIPLKLRGSLNVPRLPQAGQASSASGLPAASSRWSARKRLWHELHSVSGSVNVATCPLVSQTSRARMTQLSRPTTSSRPCTIARHHWRLTLFLSSTPSGP